MIHYPNAKSRTATNRDNNPQLKQVRECSRGAGPCAGRRRVVNCIEMTYPTYHLGATLRAITMLSPVLRQTPCVPVLKFQYSSSGSSTSKSEAGRNAAACP